MIRLLLFVSLPLYILDQWTKLWIVRNFALFDDETEVIFGTFWLHHVPNTNITFNLFNGSTYANWVFGAISITALVMLRVFYKMGVFSGRASRIALLLLVAGIIGNFTDRLLHGYVVDFLRFDFGFWPFNPWPSFNVADACVVVAASLLVLASFTEPPPATGKQAT
jgi:signal peptidase II